MFQTIEEMQNMLGNITKNSEAGAAAAALAVVTGLPFVATRENTADNATKQGDTYRLYNGEVLVLEAKGRSAFANALGFLVIGWNLSQGSIRDQLEAAKRRVSDRVNLLRSTILFDIQRIAPDGEGDATFGSPIEVEAKEAL